MHVAARVRARLSRLPDWVVDGVLALLVLASDLWFHRSVPLPHWGGATWAQVAGLVVGTVPLAFRQRVPRLVWAMVAPTAVLVTVAGLGASELGLCVALFTLGSQCSRRFSVAALGSFMPIKLFADVVGGFSSWIPIIVLAYTASWALGDQRRNQQELTQELQRRAEQLERERADKIKRATADERARIARDLHDVVAHSVSVMVLHTAAARRMFARDPRRAEQAFAQVETTGRQSLSELRQLLGLLREADGGAELTPQPRLAYLPELVERFVVVGLPVRLDVRGQVRPLGAVVDLCAYRIVQEALTNALKHAEADNVEVTLDYGADELRIEVLDDGRGGNGGDRNGSRGGHGLVGMRERAALVGGHLRAEHRPGDGFSVSAVLPGKAP